jgi:phosphohistidine phosphatase
MRLYLIRHGIAEPRRSGEPDAGRRLTEDGRARVVRSVKGVNRIGLRFDALLA